MQVNYIYFLVQMYFRHTILFRVGPSDKEEWERMECVTKAMEVTTDVNKTPINIKNEGL